MRLRWIQRSGNIQEDKSLNVTIMSGNMEVTSEGDPDLRETPGDTSGPGGQRGWRFSEEALPKRRRETWQELASNAGLRKVPAGSPEPCASQRAWARTDRTDPGEQRGGESGKVRMEGIRSKGEGLQALERN